MPLDLDRLTDVEEQDLVGLDLLGEPLGRHQLDPLVGFGPELQNRPSGQRSPYSCHRPAYEDAKRRSRRVVGEG